MASGNNGLLGFSNNSSLLSAYPSELMEVGLDYTNVTGGTSYTRVTNRLVFYIPFLLTALKWNLFTNGTYNVDFISDHQGSTSILSVVENFITAGGQATYTMIPSNGNIMIPPGIYYLSIWSTVVKKMPYNASEISIQNGIAFLRSSWNLAAPTNDQQAVKFVGYQMTNAAETLRYAY